MVGLFLVFLIVGGPLAIYFLLKHDMKAFHVDVKPIVMKVMGMNIFPMFIFMMKLMPDSIRRKMITKQVMQYLLNIISKLNDIVECTQARPSRP